MKAKYLVGLLAAIILTVAPALAQQSPPAPPTPPDEEFGNTFSFFIDGGGFLGVYGEDINNENMGRYRLTQPRGVGVTRVMNDSPAEKAGLRKDDVILRLDGENVTSVRKLNRLVSEIAPDHTVKIAISRNGSEQELTATMGKRRSPTSARGFYSPAPRVWKFEGPRADGNKFGFDLDDNNDFSFFFTNSRRIGVSTIELTKQLADYFGITGGKGVLVTAVVEDGPAAKAGIKAGDVITEVDGEAIDSPGEIARVIGKKKEGEVTLIIVRNKNQQTFRVTPQEGGFHGTFGRPSVGRQIVIPRIQIPDVNIAVPAVDIQLPRVRINPRIRISRGVYGPI